LTEQLKGPFRKGLSGRETAQRLEGDAKHLKESLLLDGGAPPISTLRGAHVDNREWLDDPVAPIAALSSNGSAETGIQKGQEAPHASSRCLTAAGLHAPISESCATSRDRPALNRRLINHGPPIHDIHQPARKNPEHVFLREGARDKLAGRRLCACDRSTPPA
jgi:hypothetical protein